jgi:hypothetical protein
MHQNAKLISQKNWEEINKVILKIAKRPGREVSYLDNEIK